MAVPDYAFLDSQQTAWITLPGGDQTFETQPG
jgi:hypothetical protein